MRRRSGMLNLHRETLRHLEPENFKVAGAGSRACPNSQTCSTGCKLPSWCMCTDGACDTSTC